MKACDECQIIEEMVLPPQYNCMDCYKILENEITKLKEDNAFQASVMIDMGAVMIENEKLKAENEMMRKGLEYYGDHEIYRIPKKDRNGMGGMSSQRDFEIDDGEWKMVNGEIDHYCYGKKAREILKTIDENKKGVE